ncbi:inositol monophosphatase family protein [Actinoplanes xinjiangensis]|uniref:inositol monophosphatase family protein n=1 Tax=Actinoplanes xinjiangensis TaxID=512350 RepID=UPI0034492BB4
MSITDRDLVIAAAEAGAAVVRSHYGSSLARLPKEGDDFATVADIEAEKAILAILRDARPGDVVLGEESGRTGDGGSDRMWLVDPLCGTLNYAVHTMPVSVNVALRVGDRVTVAASADPFTEEVFWTGGDGAHVRQRGGAHVRQGGGAHVRQGGGDRPLVPSAGSRLVDLNLDPPFPNRPDFLAAALLADDGFITRFRPRVVSTTLAVAWVAAGRRAAYITDGHLRDSVHFAAGIALCEAAGCVVTGLDGQPLHTGRGGLVAAADAETHTALLRLIAGRRVSR